MGPIAAVAVLNPEGKAVGAAEGVLPRTHGTLLAGEQDMWGAEGLVLGFCGLCGVASTSFGSPEGPLKASG